MSPRSCATPGIGDPLTSCFTCTVLFELVNHGVEVGVAGSELLSEPVATAFDNSLAIRDHFELTDLAGCGDGINA
jgi:hypothetical protein